VSGVGCIIRYTAWKFHSRQIFQSCISSFVICIIRARYFIRKKSRFAPTAAAAAALEILKILTFGFAMDSSERDKM
jgi:hypothetical protein